MPVCVCGRVEGPLRLLQTTARPRGAASALVAPDAETPEDAAQAMAEDVAGDATSRDGGARGVVGYDHQSQPQTVEFKVRRRPAKVSQ